jgi:2-polyprenyl-6-methoxyphenol hydroxylase-like FAD-dependent oxidoreductase
MQPVSIIGGGIAGLTLGILLRERGVPVRLWEAQNYPRHRVCGEFISGTGADLLAELVPEVARRARPARTVRFFTDGHATSDTPLPSPGLSIARWELDKVLADRFLKSGGELIHNQRWTESYEQEGIVRATGRRLASGQNGWIGLKAHFDSCETRADLEMHFSNHGYVGVSKLPHGTNVCALVHRNFPLEKFRTNAPAVFASLLGEQAASRVCRGLDPGSISAVSGISFEASNPPSECCVGDALRMVPPFTGNGMSIAVESAFGAAHSLTEYSEERRTWPQTLREVNTGLRKLFRRRFAAANLLHSVAHRSWTRRVMLSGLRTFSPLLPLCFKATR